MYQLGVFLYFLLYRSPDSMQSFCYREASAKMKKLDNSVLFFSTCGNSICLKRCGICLKKKILPNAVQQVQTCFGNEGVSGVSAEGNSRLCNLL